MEIKQPSEEITDRGAACIYILRAHPSEGLVCKKTQLKGFLKVSALLRSGDIGLCGRITSFKHDYVSVNPHSIVLLRNGTVDGGFPGLWCGFLKASLLASTIQTFMFQK